MKTVIPPAFGVAFLLADAALGLPEQVQFVMNLLAVTILVAGVFVVMRYRAALAATEATARAWREERDAERSKLERLTEEGTLKEATILKLTTQVEELQARPDMTDLLREVVSGRESAVDTLQVRLDRIEQLLIHKS